MPPTLGRLGLAVIGLSALMLVGCRGGEKGSETRAGSDTSAKTAGKLPRKGTDKRAALCKDRSKPTATHLGLKPHFVHCLEAMLSVMKLPKEAKQPFAEGKPKRKDATSAWVIQDYISIVLKEKDGYVEWAEVYFLDKYRKKGGVMPVLLAQALTLAVVFPSAKADPIKGNAIWKEIDAIGRKTNNHLIKIERDGNRDRLRPEHVPGKAARAHRVPKAWQAAADDPSAAAENEDRALRELHPQERTRKCVDPRGLFSSPGHHRCRWRPPPSR